jgi:hypothetical protein
MDLDWSHKWIKLLSKADHIKEGFPCSQMLTAPVISTVECDICGCSEVHEDALKPCPKEQIYCYLKLENGQTIKMKIKE